MNDQPTTGQERPARLSAEREWGIRNVGTIGSERALLDELDALRSERDAWKAKAERLEKVMEEVAMFWRPVARDLEYNILTIDSVRFLAQDCLNMLQKVLTAETEHRVEWDGNPCWCRGHALAEPQPPAEPTTADHPWFTWLPPTTSVHRQCCDRPQSEHPPGDIVVRRARGLVGKGE
jgi:hypothetical protein